MNNYSPKLKIMLDAVHKAGKRLSRDFGELENLQVSKKGTNDFVSSSDIATEKAIVDMLMRYYPKYSFLLEESPAVVGEDPEFRWILDPIDGTMNFIHGHPFFCISLALEQKMSSGERQIIAAVIHAPVLGETYYAEKGKGAFIETYNRGNNRLRVANRKKLEDCLCTTGSYGVKGTEQHNIVDFMSSKVARIRIAGSAALDLAYVASGRCDLFTHNGLHPWDIAAGSLLITEAGGVITALDETKNFMAGQSLVAGNEVVHYKALRLINQHLSQ
ncbi:MAG: inositol monophosphatase [Rickettsiales bacterium]|nr:inositol monophosphatase [Rickettsiales bacterium]